jgi:DNA-binding transcriptional regulator YiaG
MNSDGSSYVVIRNPVTSLREDRGWSSTDLADALGVGLSEVQNIEEGIPHTLPRLLYDLMPELLERSNEYQDFRNWRRKVYKATLAPSSQPTTPEEFRQFLHSNHLTPQEFSRNAKVPVSEVFYAMRTRLPASIEGFFNAG